MDGAVVTNVNSSYKLQFWTISKLIQQPNFGDETFGLTRPPDRVSVSQTSYKGCIKLMRVVWTIEFQTCSRS
jgi:hypothetical protein